MTAAAVIAWLLVSALVVVGAHWLLERAFPRAQSWLQAADLRRAVRERDERLSAVAGRLRALDSGAHAVVVPSAELRRIAEECER